MKHFVSVNICAADDGKDSCQGDSGGPLVVKRGGELRLVGVLQVGKRSKLRGKNYSRGKDLTAGRTGAVVSEAGTMW